MRINLSDKVQNPNFGRFIVSKGLENSIKKSPELESFVKKATETAKDYEWGDILMSALPGTAAGIAYYTCLHQPVKEGNEIKQKYIEHVELNPALGLLYDITNRDFREPQSYKTYQNNQYTMQTFPVEKQESYEKALELVQENEIIATRANRDLEEEIANEQDFQSEMENLRDIYNEDEY